MQATVPRPAAHTSRQEEGQERHPGVGGRERKAEEGEAHQAQGQGKEGVAPLLLPQAHPEEEAEESPWFLDIEMLEVFQLILVVFFILAM